MATRSKRLRGTSLGASDAHGGDHDFPLHMDPSLMTERQQLAFLLRKTAQENGQDATSSSRESSSASEGSDDDDAPRRAPKKPRRAAPSSKTSPRSPPAASREDLIAAALKNPAGIVLYCGRGRPPKNAIKLAPGEEMPADLKKLVETAAHHLRRRDTSANANASTSASDVVKDLRVKTDTSESRSRDEQDRKAPQEEEEVNRDEEHQDTTKRKATKLGDSAAARDKISPSSASELSQHLRDVYEDHHGDFALATPCALCCRVSSPFDAPLDALFLCPTCDRKYPTQRALGLV